MDHKLTNMDKIKLLITIVDRYKGEKIVEFLKSEKIAFHLIALGHGTADSEILDYLGLSENEKDIILSVIPECKTKFILNHLNQNMTFYKNGNGIAFTLPISSFSGVFTNQIFDELDVVKEEENVTIMNNSKSYKLIITIMNNGFSDQAIKAAKDAGANGGTLIHARSLSSEEITKFLGISIQPEKEILVILSKDENTKDIMIEIINSVGIKTPGKAMCFSLPVDDVIGLRSS